MHTKPLVALALLLAALAVGAALFFEPGSDAAAVARPSEHSTPGRRASEPGGSPGRATQSQPHLGRRSDAVAATVADDRDPGAEQQAAGAWVAVRAAEGLELPGGLVLRAVYFSPAGPLHDAGGTCHLEQHGTWDLSAQLAALPGDVERVLIYPALDADLILEPAELALGELEPGVELEIDRGRPGVVTKGPDTRWTVTDENGRFEQPQLPFGLVRIKGMFDQSAVLRHVDSVEHELRFASGPLVRLDFEPPGGLTPTDFVAALYRAPEELIVEEGLLEVASPWSPDGATRTDSWSNAAPVRLDPTDRGAWTRFAPEERDHPMPSFVVLASRDGSALGHARIDDPDAHRTTPLRVELEERANIRGEIVWPSIRTGRADLSLTALGEDGEDDVVARRWLWRSWSEPSTPFVLQDLEPGPYELRLEGSELETLVCPAVAPSPSRYPLCPLERDRGVLSNLEGRVLTRLEFALVDPPAEIPVMVMVHGEAGTGYPTRFYHRFMPAERPASADTTPALLETSFGPFPTHTELTVEVIASGHLNLQLDDMQIETEHDGTRRARVALRAGFAASLSVYEFQGEERHALPGIVLALDELVLAPSDEHGEARFEGEATPRVLRVVSPGWELVDHHSWSDWGAVFADSGHVTFEDRMLDVLLRRSSE